MNRMMTALALGVSVFQFQIACADFAPGEVIVKYKAGSDRSRVKMNRLYFAIGTTHVKRLGGTMEDLEVLSFSPDLKIQDAITDLQRDESVEFAQPNFLLHTMPLTNETRFSASPSLCWFSGLMFPPGCQDGALGDSKRAGRQPVQAAPPDLNPMVPDAMIRTLYGMAQIGAMKAWGSHIGDRRLIVANIDTGIDYNHPDLAANLWRNPRPTRGDVIGYDFVHNDGLPFDIDEHGTHTAGTIGAVGGNGIGVLGVSPRVSIMTLKFIDGKAGGKTSQAIQAIDYGIAHGARIMSNSWGGDADEDNPALSAAIDRAQRAGILFVVAAGNGGKDHIGDDNDSSPHRSFPAAFTHANLISVAATNAAEQLTLFSNYGVRTTHLAAPGSKIMSTIPGGRYEAVSGTSMACPHVAGAAALIWSKNPRMSAAQVKAILLGSVDQLASLQGKVATGGRLNVLRALQAVR